LALLLGGLIVEGLACGLDLFDAEVQLAFSARPGAPASDPVGSDDFQTDDDDDDDDPVVDAGEPLAPAHLLFASPERLHHPEPTLGLSALYVDPPLHVPRA
jgi:hypothetical protein